MWHQGASITSFFNEHSNWKQTANAKLTLNLLEELGIWISCLTSQTRYPVENKQVVSISGK